jgi:hypothetical protein
MKKWSHNKLAEDLANIKRRNIQKVTADEAEKIIETRKPEGLFYFIDRNDPSYWDQVYIGIDNSTGEAWVEEFETEEECIHWLDGGGEDE